MEDIELICSSSNFDKEDFETMASDVRSKIQTYFSQLIEVIQLRETKLISELDEIISHFRQEREKLKELEKMKKYHEELYSSSTFKSLQADILGKIENELTGMKEETMDKMVLEFEWNQKYAREANELGKLKKIHPNQKYAREANELGKLKKIVPESVEIVNTFTPSLPFKARPQGIYFISSSPSKTIPQHVKSPSKGFPTPLISPVLIGHQPKKHSSLEKSLLTLTEQRPIKRKVSLSNPSEILKRICAGSGNKSSKSLSDDGPLPDPSFI